MKGQRGAGEPTGEPTTYQVVMVDLAGTITHLNGRPERRIESRPNNQSGNQGENLSGSRSDKLFGYDRNELIGSNLALLFPERHRQAYLESFQRLIANPQNLAPGSDRELAIRCQNGSEIPSELCLIPITSSSGTQILCVLLDTSRRKRAEDALRNSEAQLRLFIDQAPVSICMFDRDMRYIAASKRWIGDYGRGLRDLIGICHYDIHPELPDSWKKVHRRGLAGEFQHCEEELWIQADGSRTWLRWAVHPWIDREGNTGGIIIFAEDITARKQTEELLQKKKQQLADITDNIPGPLALFDKDVRYLFINRSYEQLIGKTCAEVIGLTAAEVIGTDAVQRAEPSWQLARAGRQVTYENHIESVGGDRTYAQVTIVPHHGPDGQIASYLLIGTDVTALKQAEQALSAAKEALELRVHERTAALEAANKELEAFSYSVSHDLRAPLRAMDGLARIVLDDFGVELTPKVCEFLHGIRASAEQMRRLIDDLLSFARFNRQPIRREQIDTMDLVRAIIGSLQPTPAGRRVQLRISELPPCHADPRLLKQVWANLLDNALKYTSRRDPAVIDIGCERGAGSVTYFVCDNGVGFDMQYATKLFGVFQRLHPARDYAGTGVGLAISHRIIERHGGRIWADARPNQGATFYFTLSEPEGPSDAK